MGLVALVVASSRCCGVAECQGAKTPSPEVGFSEGDSRRQQPHKTLVDNGFGGSDGP